jgi:hypothetical protein
VTDTREVKQFGWHGWVSRPLWRKWAFAVRRMLREDLEAKVREQGHEPLADTFDYQLIWPGDPEAAWLPPEDREFLNTRDVVYARTWLRCYSIEEAA